MNSTWIKKYTYIFRKYYIEKKNEFIFFSIGKLVDIFALYKSRFNDRRNIKTLCITISCPKLSLDTTWYCILLNPWYSNHTLNSYSVFSTTSRLLCLLNISAFNKSILTLKLLTFLQAVIIFLNFLSLTRLSRCACIHPVCDLYNLPNIKNQQF